MEEKILIFRNHFHLENEKELYFGEVRIILKYVGEIKKIILINFVDNNLETKLKCFCLCILTYSKSEDTNIEYNEEFLVYYGKQTKELLFRRTSDIFGMKFPKYLILEINGSKYLDSRKINVSEDGYLGFYEKTINQRVHWKDNCSTYMLTYRLMAINKIMIKASNSFNPTLDDIYPDARIISKYCDGFCSLDFVDNRGDTYLQHNYFIGQHIDIFRSVRSIHVSKSPKIDLSKNDFLNFEDIIENMDDRILFSILNRLFPPRSFIQLFFKKKFWTRENHKWYTYKFQHFIKFILWLSKQKSCFSQISKDVLLHKIFPFLDEKEIFFQRFSILIVGFFFLKCGKNLKAITDNFKELDSEHANSKKLISTFSGPSTSRTEKIVKIMNKPVNLISFLEIFSLVNGYLFYYFKENVDSKNIFSFSVALKFFRKYFIMKNVEDIKITEKTLKICINQMFLFEKPDVSGALYKFEINITIDTIKAIIRGLILVLDICNKNESMKKDIQGVINIFQESGNELFSGLLINIFPVNKRMQICSLRLMINLLHFNQISNIFKEDVNSVNVVVRQLMCIIDSRYNFIYYPSFYIAFYLMNKLLSLKECNLSISEMRFILCGLRRNEKNFHIFGKERILKQNWDLEEILELDSLVTSILFSLFKKNSSDYFKILEEESMIDFFVYSLENQLFKFDVGKRDAMDKNKLSGNIGVFFPYTLMLIKNFPDKFPIEEIIKAVFLVVKNIGPLYKVVNICLLELFEIISIRKKFLEYYDILIVIIEMYFVEIKNIMKYTTCFTNCNLKDFERYVLTIVYFLKLCKKNNCDNSKLRFLLEVVQFLNQTPQYFFIRIVLYTSIVKLYQFLLKLNFFNDEIMKNLKVNSELIRIIESQCEKVNDLLLISPYRICYELYKNLCQTREIKSSGKAQLRKEHCDRQKKLINILNSVLVYSKFECPNPNQLTEPDLFVRKVFCFGCFYFLRRIYLEYPVLSIDLEKFSFFLRQTVGAYINSIQKIKPFLLDQVFEWVLKGFKESTVGFKVFLDFLLSFSCISLFYRRLVGKFIYKGNKLNLEMSSLISSFRKFVERSISKISLFIKTYGEVTESINFSDFLVLYDSLFEISCNNEIKLVLGSGEKFFNLHVDFLRDRIEVSSDNKEEVIKKIFMILENIVNYESSFNFLSKITSQNLSYSSYFHNGIWVQVCFSFLSIMEKMLRNNKSKLTESILEKVFTIYFEISSKISKGLCSDNTKIKEGVSNFFSFFIKADLLAENSKKLLDEDLVKFSKKILFEIIFYYNFEKLLLFLSKFYGGEKKSVCNEVLNELAKKYNEQNHPKRYKIIQKEILNCENPIMVLNTKKSKNMNVVVSEPWVTSIEIPKWESKKNEENEKHNPNKFHFGDIPTNLSIENKDDDINSLRGETNENGFKFSLPFLGENLFDTGNENKNEKDIKDQVLNEENNIFIF